jgi:hypothetical protein
MPRVAAPLVLLPSRQARQRLAPGDPAPPVRMAESKKRQGTEPPRTGRSQSVKDHLPVRCCAVGCAAAAQGSLSATCVSALARQRRDAPQRIWRRRQHWAERGRSTARACRWRPGRRVRWAESQPSLAGERSWRASEARGASGPSKRHRGFRGCLLQRESVDVEKTWRAPSRVSTSCFSACDNGGVDKPTENGLRGHWRDHRRPDIRDRARNAGAAAATADIGKGRWRRRKGDSHRALAGRIPAAGGNSLVRSDPHRLGKS